VGPASVIENNVFYFSVLFTGSVSEITAGGLQGQGPVPVEVAPKETKTIQLIVDDNFQTLAKGATEAGFQTSFNSKVVGALLAKKLEGVWKLDGSGSRVAP